MVKVLQIKRAYKLTQILRMDVYKCNQNNKNILYRLNDMQNIDTVKQPQKISTISTTQKYIMSATAALCVNSFDVVHFKWPNGTNIVCVQPIMSSWMIFVPLLSFYCDLFHFNGKSHTHALTCEKKCY